MVVARSFETQRGGEEAVLSGDALGVVCSKEKMVCGKGRRRMARVCR